MNAGHHTRAKRLDDALENHSANGLTPDGTQVLCHAYLNREDPDMGNPYHVSDQRFKIAPIWFEYREATLGGLSLELMQPMYMEPGTRVFLECGMYWASTSMRHRGGGSSYYKTGPYSISRVNILIVRPKEPTPVFFEGAADVSSEPHHVFREHVRRYLLGTIGVKSVDVNSIHYVYLGAGNFGFDIAPY